MKCMEWVVVFTVILPLIIVLAAVSNGRRAVAEKHMRKLVAVERKLDLIMEHLGVREPELANLAVLEELMAGRKIQAIKAYREATGAGLKEARDAVELLARQRGLG
jgi:ribosomal protein L7/L12